MFAPRKQTSYPERTFNNVASALGRCQSLETDRCPRAPDRKTTSTQEFVRKTKAERQREIVEATVQLVGKYGVQGTTVSRIAQAAGIARGALYQHFPNREAVLEAAMAAMGERSSGLDRSSRPARTCPGACSRMGEAHSSWSLSEYNTFVRPFFQLIASNRETGLTKMIIEQTQEDLR